MADAKTVLIVDDEPDAIAIVEVVLSEIEGVSTISAPDGDTGIALAREKSPDLMILDVQMPERTGFDVFAELRKDDATASIPVIMVTGVAEKAGLPFSAEEMKDFLGDAPEAYLEKPVDMDALRKAVSQILGL